MQSALSFSELIAAGLAGAVVVVSGGLYALFLAWHYLHRNALHRTLAFAAYFTLVLAFVVLARALRLDMAWDIAILFLLAVYLVAPHLIWRLTVATHENEHHARTSGSNLSVSRSVGRIPS